MLLPIENVLEKDEIAACRQLLAQGPWQEGMNSAGGQAAQVKSNQQLDDRSSTAARLRELVLTRLSTDPLFVSAALPAQVFPPKFNRYCEGGHYGLHVDSAIMSLVGGGQLRTDISCTLFLCDADSYIGGELCIESQFGVQEVKLNAGDMILYPSNSLHEVKPVTDGERVAAFFWVQSMVRHGFRREQLFELDQAIQRLTIDRGAGDAEVRRLSSVYHNLLREWAEV